MQPKFYGAAAEYNKPAGFQPNKRWLVIGGLVVLILAVVMVTIGIFSAIAAGPSRDVATLVARETDLSNILDKNRQKLSGDLGKVNAEANILLLSDINTLSSFMKSVYHLSGVPKDITTAETDTDIEAQLSDAEQIGRFETSYADMLQTKVGTCQTLAEKVLAASGDQDFKAALQQNIENLKAVSAQLSDLNF